MSSNPYAKQSQMWPLTEAVRAYVLPIDRNSGTSVPFDPSAQGEFDLDLAPVPFLDVGWVENFQRTSATQYAVSGNALRTFGCTRRSGLSCASPREGRAFANCIARLPAWPLKK